MKKIRFYKRFLKLFFRKHIARKLIALVLIGLFNAFHLAVAAAPSDPLMPTLERLTQITSLVALTPLENHYRAVRVKLTGYSSTPDQTDDTPFITAANTITRDGIVASNFLPFGTRIRIPELFGDKIFIVEDRMNERFKDRIDIWFTSRIAARNFGVQKAEIQIL